MLHNLDYIKFMEFIHFAALEKYHGLHGPLSVSKQGHSVLVNEWISAAKEFGFESSDPNGRQTSS